MVPPSRGSWSFKALATSMSLRPAPDVDVNGREDDEAPDDRLEREVHSRLVEPLVQDADDDRPEERPGDRADAAREAGPPHDDRGDGRQLEPLSGAGLARVELR